jgi:hypothetical protein
VFFSIVISRNLRTPHDSLDPTNASARVLVHGATQRRDEATGAGEQSDHREMGAVSMVRHEDGG